MILRISGADARPFLQGLITNNVEHLNASHPIYAALLTPQGKIISDFMLFEAAAGIFIDCASAHVSDLVSRLSRYRLRAKVSIDVLGPSTTVAAAASKPPEHLDSFATFSDPRYPGLGHRWILNTDNPAATLGAHGIELEPKEHYERHRIECCIPDSVRDLEADSYFPLDCNFEELHGVDFDKGCYVGQELTSRMKHRATSRRRILPVSATGSLPPAGTKITIADIEIGEMRGSLGPIGLALVRLDKLGGAETATTGTTNIRIGRPPYPLAIQTDHT